MGFRGALQFLQPFSKPENIARYEQHTVAIDGMCWIHRACMSCAVQLAAGEGTEEYLRFLVKMIALLKFWHIRHIIVFDGARLRAKRLEEFRRGGKREAAFHQFTERIQTGMPETQFEKDKLQRWAMEAVTIDSRILSTTLKLLDRLGVPYLMAPYEADAQLAYLMMKRYVQLVISEDSDLLVYGCGVLMCKMDTQGWGTIVDLRFLNVPNCGFPPTARDIYQCWVLQGKPPLGSFADEETHNREIPYDINLKKGFLKKKTICTKSSSKTPQIYKKNVTKNKRYELKKMIFIKNSKNKLSDIKKTNQLYIRSINHQDKSFTKYLKYKYFTNSRKNIIKELNIQNYSKKSVVKICKKNIISRNEISKSLSCINNIDGKIDQYKNYKNISEVSSTRFKFNSYDTNFLPNYEDLIKKVISNTAFVMSKKTELKLKKLYPKNFNITVRLNQSLKLHDEEISLSCPIFASDCSNRQLLSIKEIDNDVFLHHAVMERAAGREVNIPIQTNHAKESEVELKEESIVKKKIKTNVQKCLPPIRKTVSAREAVYFHPQRSAVMSFEGFLNWGCKRFLDFCLLAGDCDYTPLFNCRIPGHGYKLMQQYMNEFLQWETSELVKRVLAPRLSLNADELMKNFELLLTLFQYHPVLDLETQNITCVSAAQTDLYKLPLSVQQLIGSIEPAKDRELSEIRLWIKDIVPDPHLERLQFIQSAKTVSEEQAKFFYESKSDISSNTSNIDNNNKCDIIGPKKRSYNTNSTKRMSSLLNENKYVLDELLKFSSTPKNQDIYESLLPTARSRLDEISRAFPPNPFKNKYSSKDFYSLTEYRGPHPPTETILVNDLYDCSREQLISVIGLLPSNETEILVKCAGLMDSEGNTLYSSKELCTSEKDSLYQLEQHTDAIAYNMERIVQTLRSRLEDRRQELSVYNKLITLPKEVLYSWKLPSLIKSDDLSISDIKTYMKSVVLNSMRYFNSIRYDYILYQLAQRVINSTCSVKLLHFREIFLSDTINAENIDKPDIFTQISFKIKEIVDTIKSKQNYNTSDKDKILKQSDTYNSKIDNISPELLQHLNKLVLSNTKEDIQSLQKIIKEKCLISTSIEELFFFNEFNKIFNNTLQNINGNPLNNLTEPKINIDSTMLSDTSYIPQKLIQKTEILASQEYISHTLNCSLVIENINSNIYAPPTCYYQKKKCYYLASQLTFFMFLLQNKNVLINANKTLDIEVLNFISGINGTWSEINPHANTLLFTSLPKEECDMKLQTSTSSDNLEKFSSFSNNSINEELKMHLIENLNDETKKQPKSIHIQGFNIEYDKMEDKNKIENTVKSKNSEKISLNSLLGLGSSKQSVACKLFNHGDLADDFSDIALKLIDSELSYNIFYEWLIMISTRIASIKKLIMRILYSKDINHNMLRTMSVGLCYFCSISTRMNTYTTAEIKSNKIFQKMLDILNITDNDLNKLIFDVIDSSKEYTPDLPIYLNDHISYDTINFADGNDDIKCPSYLRSKQSKKNFQLNRYSKKCNDIINSINIEKFNSYSSENTELYINKDSQYNSTNNKCDKISDINYKVNISNTNAKRVLFASSDNISISESQDQIFSMGNSNSNDAFFSQIDTDCTDLSPAISTYSSLESSKITPYRTDSITNFSMKEEISQLNDNDFHTTIYPGKKNVLVAQMLPVLEQKTNQSLTKVSKKIIRDILNEDFDYNLIYSSSQNYILQIIVENISLILQLLYVQISGHAGNHLKHYSNVKLLFCTGQLEIAKELLDTKHIILSSLIYDFFKQQILYCSDIPKLPKTIADYQIQYYQDIKKSNNKNTIYELEGLSRKVPLENTSNILLENLSEENSEYVLTSPSEENNCSIQMKKNKNISNNNIDNVTDNKILLNNDLSDDNTVLESQYFKNSTITISPPVYNSIDILHQLKKYFHVIFKTWRDEGLKIDRELPEVQEISIPSDESYELPHDLGSATKREFFTASGAWIRFLQTIKDKRAVIFQNAAGIFFYPTSEAIILLSAHGEHIGAQPWRNRAEQQSICHIAHRRLLDVFTSSQLDSMIPQYSHNDPVYVKRLPSMYDIHELQILKTSRHALDPIAMGITEEERKFFANETCNCIIKNINSTDISPIQETGLDCNETINTKANISNSNETLPSHTISHKSTEPHYHCDTPITKNEKEINISPTESPQGNNILVDSRLTALTNVMDKLPENISLQTEAIWSRADIDLDTKLNWCVQLVNHWVEKENTSITEVDQKNNTKIVSNGYRKSSRKQDNILDELGDIFNTTETLEKPIKSPKAVIINTPTSTNRRKTQSSYHGLQDWL